jgi:hypothetical protein
VQPIPRKRGLRGRQHVDVGAARGHLIHVSHCLESALDAGQRAVRDLLQEEKVRVEVAYRGLCILRAVAQLD